MIGRAIAGLAVGLTGAALAEPMESSLRPKPRPEPAAMVEPEPVPEQAEGMDAVGDAVPEPPPEAVPEPANAAPVPLFPGQHVFAVVEARCGVQADFLRGYWAEVVEPGDLPELRLREHLALMANHGLTDDQGNPDTSSTFWGDYWCIPQRAWCYGPVPDTAFAGKLTTGSVVAWEGGDVAPLANDFLPTFVGLLEERCPAPADPNADVTPAKADPARFLPRFQPQ
jgi:hypothetical protein